MSLVETRRTVVRTPLWPIRPAVVYALLTGLMASTLLVALIAGISTWTLGAVVAMPFFAITAIWISGGAATSVLGSVGPRLRYEPVPPNWTPEARTAILVALCGEEPAPLARHLAALTADLERMGLGRKTRVFVLSDTSGAERIAAEEAAFRTLVASGSVRYRRRVRNTGRKPGNIADWFEARADDFDFMMVLDADSRMTARRIRRMIWHLTRRPDVGLLQAGIGLVPGTTRFGRHQRIASRLLTRTFGRGFAAWTGDDGNYWGHNAIMRTAAFRAASRLPRLSGPAPFGGDLLSHDFVEAAWIRRAGWSVTLDPDPLGSAEAAPQTLAEFHRRDRRWCQGNLQHVRLVGAPGLSPISRVHLMSGVLSYLVAPAWLIIVALIATGAVSVSGVVPLLLVVFVIALPKICALADWLDRARTPWRRRVALRAWGAECAVSSILAPLVMVRQVGAVVSVCLGRDCGWTPERMTGLTRFSGGPECVVGTALIGLSWAANGSAALWLLPIALPLCAAPLLVRTLDARV